MNHKQFNLHNYLLSVNFLLPKLSKLIIYVLGARLLSQADFGLFAYIHVMVEIFQHIFGGGIDNIAARYYQGKENWKPYWQSGVCLKLLMSIVGAILGLFIFDSPHNLFFAVWFICLMLGRILYAYANTLLVSRWIVTASTTSSCLLVVIGIIGMKIGGVNGLLIAFIIERLSEILILMMGMGIKQINPIASQTIKVLSTNAVKIFKYSLPVWFSQALYIVYSRVDAILIKYLLGYTELAKYSLTYRIGEAPLFLFCAVVDSALSFYYNYPADKKCYYDKAGKRIVLIGVLAVLGLHLFACYGVVPLLGEQYKEARSLIASYSWAGIPIGLSMLHSHYLVAKYKEKVFPRIGLIVVGINFIGNFCLIPLVGLVAACWVTVASAGINWLLLRKASQEYQHRDWGIVTTLVLLSITSSYLF